MLAVSAGQAAHAWPWAPSPLPVNLWAAVG